MLGDLTFSTISPSSSENLPHSFCLKSLFRVGLPHSFSGKKLFRVGRRYVGIVSYMGRRYVGTVSYMGRCHRGNYTGCRNATHRRVPTHHRPAPASQYTESNHTPSPLARRIALPPSPRTLHHPPHRESSFKASCQSNAAWGIAKLGQAARGRKEVT